MCKYNFNPRPRKLVCPFCKKKYKKGDEFCPNCNARILYEYPLEDKTPPASKDDVCYRCKGDRYIVVMGVEGKRGADQKTCPSCLGSGIRYVHMPHSSLRKIEEEAIIEGKSEGRKESFSIEEEKIKRKTLQTIMKLLKSRQKHWQEANEGKIPVLMELQYLLYKVEMKLKRGEG